MSTYIQQDYTRALEAFRIMIEKSERAQLKFKEKSAQYTLLHNRIHALRSCIKLINHQDLATTMYTEEELENIIPPIISLRSKSQKGITKLKDTSWQYKMLKKHIDALQLAEYSLQQYIKKEGAI